MKKSTEFPSVVIKEITFNNDNKIKFNKDDIILLVGANNVGKSRALKDLREDLNNTSKSKVIIKDVAYETTGFSGDKLRDYFERNIAKSSYG
ncbi:TPA: ATPase, partial [Streptococcus equi subsp. zooepidemicus]|nr:ATPase [Streptococcus equi subsp. zooepidemicus]